VIVRINQFDPANTEPYSGWGDEGMSGPILYDWPEDAHAFEVLILESDERQRQLAPNFRQSQIRQILPQIVEALSESNEQIVARLDGPLAGGEMLAALGYITDASGVGKYSVSPVQKLDATAPHPAASMRIHLSSQRLAALCTDTNVGLQSAVRLRAFLVPDLLVNPLLDVAELFDERWSEILPRCGLVMGSMRTMQSIYLITRRYDATQVRQRIMNKLLAGASGARTV
jgi:hypothetical protein